MAKKAKQPTNKKANMVKEENIKDTVLNAEKTENVENTVLDIEKDEDTILGVEKKDSDIINEALEEETSNANNEDEQKPTTTSEEKVEETEPIEDNAEIDITTLNNKIDESVRIGKGEGEKLEDTEKNEDSQNIKLNSNNKVNTVKHNILKLFGYYWNGQLMD